MNNVESQRIEELNGLSKPSLCDDFYVVTKMPSQQALQLIGTRTTEGLHHPSTGSVGFVSHHHLLHRALTADGANLTTTGVRMYTLTPEGSATGIQEDAASPTASIDGHPRRASTHRILAIENSAISTLSDLTDQEMWNLHQRLAEDPFTTTYERSYSVANELA
eukprot:GHVU01186722.1.p2 GENE.GHVU01186722.1~~GHVU01186722.1.p2  ORF type:complete len:164 (-),score=12.85 GHVU01186722.1:411-902(-)